MKDYKSLLTNSIKINGSNVQVHDTTKEEAKQDLPIVNGSYGCTIKTKKQEPQQETLKEAFEFWSDRQRSYDKLDILIFGANWQQEQILDFLYSEITERRDYSASKMCEKVIEFIENLNKK